MKDLLTILGLCVLFAITAFFASIYSKHPEMRLIPVQNNPGTASGSTVASTTSGKQFTCDEFAFSVDVPDTDMSFSKQDDSDQFMQTVIYNWAGNYQPDISGRVSVSCRNIFNVQKTLAVPEADMQDSNWKPSKWDADFEKNYEIIKEDSSATGFAGYFIAKSKSPQVDYSEQYAYIYIVAHVDEGRDQMNFIRILYLSPKYDADSTAVFNKIKGSLRYIE